jgi:hypothetical protein
VVIQSIAQRRGVDDSSVTVEELIAYGNSPAASLPTQETVVLKGKSSGRTKGKPERLTMTGESGFHRRRDGKGSSCHKGSIAAQTSSRVVTLKDTATDIFRKELKQFDTAFASDADVTLSINQEVSGQSVVRTDGTAEQELIFTTFGADLDALVIRTKARELFTNAGLVTAEERWPVGLTKPERGEGLRLEVLANSISIVSVHRETAWVALSPKEQSRRTQAKVDPDSFDVEPVLQAMREREYLRVFDSPQALVTPYTKAYEEATGQKPPEAPPVFWKLASTPQMSKDNGKVAYYAAELAKREKGGCEADVLVFRYLGVRYIGMTDLGLGCWKHMLKTVRLPRRP